MAGTILYVDARPDLPDGLSRALSGLGFRLQQTADPDEALALARDGAVHLVMLEVLLDQGRGWDLIECIRQLEGPCGEIPVVILTRGERTPSLYGRAIELGADDFLARPVTRAEILNAVLECVEARKAAAPDDPGPGVSAADIAGATSGHLADLPVPELLLQLRGGGATGVLFLQDSEEVLVQLRNGSPMGLSSSRSGETFSDFLVRTKRISGDEHDELLERVHATGESEAAAALSIRALSQRDVRAALADRAAEPLLEAFAWSEGSWRFEPGRRLRSAYVLDRGAASWLVQGVLRWAPSRHIRAMLDRRGALYLSRVEHPPCALEDLPAPPCETEVLEAWIGDRTIADVLESGEIGERELYALLVAGLVEGRREPLLELENILQAVPVVEEEPPILELDEPLERPAVARPAEPARAPAPEPEHDPEPAPTAAASAPSPVAADSDESPDAKRAREAEQHFQEGERHLAAKRYDQAVQSFGMCAHLDPDQGEYRAHLGYALHLQNPECEPIRREALEHIAKGIKLAPEQWRPLLYLARVFIDAGEEVNARKVLGGAVRRHPDCEPLISELRRLQRRPAAEKSGLVARLRSWWGK